MQTSSAYSFGSRVSSVFRTSSVECVPAGDRTKTNGKQTDSIFSGVPESHGVYSYRIGCSGGRMLVSEQYGARRVGRLFRGPNRDYNYAR